MTTEIPHNDLVYIFQRVHENLVNYRSVILANDPATEVAPAPFHQEWSDDLLFGERHQAYEAFRESAKTQIVLRTLPQYCLTFPSRRWDYIVFLKNNTPLAYNMLKQVEREWMENPIASSNLIDVHVQSGGVFDLTVADENGDPFHMRIEAYGKGSSIRGLSYRDRRPKIVIADDLQDTEDSKSETILKKDWEWFLSDVKFLGKSSRLFVIGNNLGDKCIIERIFNNPDELGFKTKRIPQLIKGESSWPALYSTKAIIDEREKFRSIGQIDIWMREKMCVSLAEESRIFHKKDFVRYSHTMAEEIAKGCNRFMMTDPAYARHDRADYRAVVVVAVDEENNWYVLDVAYGRWGSDVLMDEIFRLVVLWKLREVGIEEGAYKDTIEPFIVKEMSRRNRFFDIIPLKARVKKEHRIKLLQPRFKAHTIYLPDEAPWLAEMEAELLAFTMEGSKGLHDDLIDALAYGEQIVKAPYGKADARKLQRKY